MEEEDEILHREGMWRDFGELQKPPEQCARLVGMGGPMKEDGTVEGGVCVEMGTVGDAEVSFSFEYVLDVSDLFS